MEIFRITSYLLSFLTTNEELYIFRKMKFKKWSYIGDTRLVSLNSWTCMSELINQITCKMERYYHYDAPSLSENENVTDWILLIENRSIDGSFRFPGQKKFFAIESHFFIFPKFVSFQFVGPLKNNSLISFCDASTIFIFHKNK